MRILWTAEEVSRATHGATTGQWNVSRVGINSRDVQSGELFVALKGEKHDAHDFVAKLSAARACEPSNPASQRRGRNER